MQTFPKPRDLERPYAGRRGHAPQLSISDDNHDVTEAIGDMYGSFEDPHDHRSQFRPLSFVSGPFGETIETSRQLHASSTPRSPLIRTTSHERPVLSTGKSHPDASPTNPSTRTLSPDDARSPSHARSPALPLHRSPSETATQQFPLNDLDYESSPAAVAQELSNLQAIRRMSMDVSGMGMDPDLPAFSSVSVPSVQPRKGAGDEDPNLLFWVPARLHPELAPKEFKTFVQDRVKTIKRSSLSETAMSSDISKSDSLRRRKSMLSREVDDGVGYQDGAERLERKKSQSGSDVLDGPAVHLQDLEALVDDPMGAMRSLSENTARRSLESNTPYEVPASEDLPILGPKPAGATLKRSTRTQYRRGSLKKGDRLAPGRRLAMKQDEGAEPMRTSTESSPIGDDVPQLPEIPGLYSTGLMRVNSAPVSSKGTVENFSRPGRRLKSPDSTSPDETDATRDDMFASSLRSLRTQPKPPVHYPPRGASTGRTVANPTQPVPVPTIVETPPPDQQRSGLLGLPPSQSSSDRKTSPERTIQPSQPPQQPLPHRPAAQRPPLSRPGSLTPRNQPAPTPPEERAAQAQQALANNQRTDALSIVPIMTEEKKPEKKTKDKKDESRKGSWGWFSSKEDDKKDKDKEKEEKKSKTKLVKGSAADKSHDNARLDVLQASIDGPPARESLVLDRRNIQVEDETPSKKVTRKTSSEKKEKDGLFSSLFGGGKKKGDKDGAGKKGHGSHRGLSPDPPPRLLRPDVDYNWSRFSILEERAIYRMAHIKLANPRRELYSQVLLSNFMYSYLAKVQQMHPQLQVPQSAAQKREMEEKKRQQELEKKQEAERHRQQQQQQGSAGSYEEFANYQRYQEQQHTRNDSQPVAYGFDDAQQHDGVSDENDASAGPVGGYSPSPQINRYGGQPQAGTTNFSGPLRGNHNGAQQQQQQQQQQSAYSNGTSQGYRTSNGGHYQSQAHRQQDQYGQVQYHAAGTTAPSSSEGSGGTPNYLGSLGPGIGKGSQKPLFTFDSDEDEDEDEFDSRGSDGYGRSSGAVGGVASRNGRW